MRRTHASSEGQADARDVKRNIADCVEYIREDGLTEDEGRVADLLYEANCAMADLPVQHEDDMREFEQAIHVQQGILALRIARRRYPKGWTNGVQA